MGAVCCSDLLNRFCDLCDCDCDCNENGHKEHIDDHSLGQTNTGWVQPQQPGIGQNPVGDDPWNTDDPVWHPPSWVGAGQPNIVDDQPPFGVSQPPFGGGQPPFGGIEQPPFGVGQPPFGVEQPQYGAGQPNIGRF